MISFYKKKNNNFVLYLVIFNFLVIFFILSGFLSEIIDVWNTNHTTNININIIRACPILASTNVNTRADVANKIFIP